MKDFALNGTVFPDGDNSNTGEFGAGDNQIHPCYKLKAYGASLGCDSTGPNCDWQITAVKYNPVTLSSEEVHTQFISTPACPGLARCPLVPLTFDGGFQDLSAIRINVTVAGLEKIWWMDDIRMGWYDNSCAAGNCRLIHS